MGNNSGNEMTKLERVILAEPRGFCAGVDVAIDAVVRLAEEHPGEKIYVRHEIVHNIHAVNDLKEKHRAVFVENLSEIPEGSRVVFSAHGTSPEFYEEAKKRNLKVTDATCDLVRLVHAKVKKYHERRFEIILIGHKGHQEVTGTMGYAPMHLVESVDDVGKLPIDKNRNVAYVTQTTLSKYDTKRIEEALRDRFVNLISTKDDLCYATTNRQGAVMAIIDKFKVGGFLVVGENNSSNSRSLVETAKQLGVKSHLLSTWKDIDQQWFNGIKDVGLTSGASVPEYLVGEVIEHLTKFFGAIVQTYVHKNEDIKFRPRILV
ncbi:4-hydroxy-3-methylbut-2-enyl diphosphate reductase [Candidatus Pacearchaeota archaeon]|nr:4-hydroxy-3-methylbut-2-enyl diphosphate reductase [Candidatus Pacearchaeota archaeon]